MTKLEQAYSHIENLRIADFFTFVKPFANDTTSIAMLERLQKSFILGKTDADFDEQLKSLANVLLGDGQKNIGTTENPNIQITNNGKVGQWNINSVVHNLTLMPKWFYAFLSLIVIPFVLYFFLADIKHWFGLDKLYTEQEKGYKVIVASFKKEQGELEAGKVIVSRLNDLKDTLEIGVKYLPIYVENDERAKYLLEHHNADQRMFPKSQYYSG